MSGAPHFTQAGKPFTFSGKFSGKL
jgi:hypothetical protein